VEGGGGWVATIQFAITLGAARGGVLFAATFPPKRQMTAEKIIMKAIVVTDQAAGTAGMKLVERPEPQPAINDVIVQIHASGFVPTELAWPSTWTDRRDRDRTDRRSPATSWPEWSPLSATARRDCR